MKPQRFALALVYWFLKGQSAFSMFFFNPSKYWILMRVGTRDGNEKIIGAGHSNLAKRVEELKRGNFAVQLQGFSLL